MNDKPETNKIIIIFVVLTLAINATIGVLVLGYCIITGRSVDPVLLTPFVGIVNFVLGAVAGMLVKTSPTESTRQPLPNPPSPPPLTNDNPAKVEVVNTPTDPVPTEEQK